MNALVIALLVTVGIGSAALAQQRWSVRDMMIEMKARYGQTFEQCQALATSRGYRLTDDEYEGRAVMIARAWAELMDRLDYTRYVAQGGDVGAAVTDAMGREAPKGRAR